MKKLISIFTSLLLTTTIFVTPVFGDDTTPSGVKVQNSVNQIVIKALQNSLKKA